jgi:putative membrane protein
MALGYEKHDSEARVLRDELAIERTALANERTLLAYLRSGIALIIAGVSIMHFVDQGLLWKIGAACVPLGMMGGVIGTIRYCRMRKAIAAARGS